MHALTHAILRELLHDRITSCGLELLRSIGQHIQRRWRPQLLFDADQSQGSNDLFEWSLPELDKAMRFLVRIESGGGVEAYFDEARDWFLSFVSFGQVWLILEKEVQAVDESLDIRFRRKAEWLLLLFCNSSDERDRIILMLLRIAKATLDQDPQ